MTDGIMELIDAASIKAYQKIMKKDSTAEDFKEIFYQLVESVYSKTYGYIKKKITGIKFKPMGIADLLYDELDEERIDKYFEEFVEGGRRNKISFLRQLDLIFNTEGHMVCNNIFIKAAEHIEAELSDERHFVRVRLYVVDEAECGAHGEQQFWREPGSIECGHPDCDCEVRDIEVEIEELEDGFLPDLEDNE